MQACLECFLAYCTAHKSSATKHQQLGRTCRNLAGHWEQHNRQQHYWCAQASLTGGRWRSNKCLRPVGLDPGGYLLHGNQDLPWRFGAMGKYETNGQKPMLGLAALLLDLTSCCCCCEPACGDEPAAMANIRADPETLYSNKTIDISQQAVASCYCLLLSKQICSCYCCSS